jgi:hypothetical protein
MKRISIAALGLIVGALLLVGCGGSGGGSTSESSTTASSAGAETAKEGEDGRFEISEEAKACLKEKGVELPEFKAGSKAAPPAGGAEPPEGFEPPEGGPPSGGEGGPGGEKFEEQKRAFEECGVEIGGGFKAGAPGGKPNINSAAFKKQVKEYVACVRENGYELAEPNFSGEGPIFERSESESAAFKKASAQCQELLGGPRGSRSG